MSEERFERIETTLAQLVTGQQELRQQISGLTEGQQSLQKGQQSLQEGQQSLQEGQQSLQKSHQSLQKSQQSLQEGQQELRRHMGVLHEEILDRIAAIPHPDYSQFATKTDLADLKESIERRLDPLEWTVRKLASEREQR